jgi:hypothetical protein
MVARTSETVGRLAVERARVRMPHLAPDSVEVVELVRGRAFVVVRKAPDGVVVLEETGRIVRGRERLAAIAAHVCALSHVRHAVAEAQLDRRVEHTSRSSALLRGVAASSRDRRLRRDLRELLAELDAYRVRLDALQEEWLRPAPATERTLRRLVSLLNAAARDDRAIVRSTRELAADIARARANGNGAAPAMLERWAIARLGCADLPFFYWELDAEDDVAFVVDFVRAARA